MTSIRLKGHTAADGNLILEAPTGLPESDVDVMVVFERSPNNGNRLPVAQWPPGFFERTYGRLGDDPIQRPDERIGK